MNKRPRNDDRAPQEPAAVYVIPRPPLAETAFAAARGKPQGVRPLVRFALFTAVNFGFVLLQLALTAFLVRAS